MRETITVKTHIDGGEVKVSADVFGSWAVHEKIIDVEYPGDPEFPWSVTAVAHGLRLPWNWARKDIADAVAKRLNETHTSIPETPDKLITREIETVIADVHAEFGEEFWP